MSWGKTLIMTNYQHYNKEKFLESFSQSDIFNKLSKKYKYLFSEYSEIDEELSVPDYESSVPRHGSHEINSSVFVYSFFYYLEFLLEKKPNLIADIGCGRNFIKEYIPNIIGFDLTPEADIQRWFDDKFVTDNLKKFDAAFAINAIHFISLTQFANRIIEFGKIIKPGGRGFLTFNLERMLTRTQPYEYAQLFDLLKPLTAIEYKDFFIKELKKIPYKILVFDILFENRYVDDIEYNNIKGSGWPPSLAEYFSYDLDKIPLQIRKEIESHNFTDKIYIDKIDDGSGNIRLVFEV